MSTPIDQTAYTQYYGSYYQPYNYTQQQQPPHQQQDYCPQQPPLPVEDSDPPPPLPVVEEERPPLPSETSKPVGEMVEERQELAPHVQGGSQNVPSDQPPTQLPSISSAQPMTQTPVVYTGYGADHLNVPGGVCAPGGVCVPGGVCAPGSYTEAQPTWTQSPTTQSATWQQSSSNQQLAWQQGWPMNQQYNNWSWDAWSGQWTPQNPGVGGSQQQPWPYYQYNQGPSQSHVQQWQNVSAEGQHSQEHPPRSPGTPPLPSIEPSIECKVSVEDPSAQVIDNRNVPPPSLSSGEDLLHTPHYGSEQSQVAVSRIFLPNQSLQETEYRGNQKEVPGHIGRNQTEVPGHIGRKHERSDYNMDDRVGEVKKSRQDSVSSQDKSIVAPPNSGTVLSEENTGLTSKWPPKFRGYVQRAFAAAVSDSDREYVHRVLDEELNRMFADKKQWEIDWDTYPLPTERLYRAKSFSRWDTPSPSRELTSEEKSPQSKIYLPLDVNSPKGRGHFHSYRARGRGLLGNAPGVGKGSALLGNSLGRGRGRALLGDGPGVGRGRALLGDSPVTGRGRSKKRRNKKGKNRFTIDTTPSQELAVEMNVEEKKRRNDRIQRFGKLGTTDGNRNFIKKVSIDELLKRTLMPGGDDGMVYWQDKSVEGTCQDLEKRYLRLTSAPEPSVVRPLHILRRSLDFVFSKWKATKDYHYACEQLKSIRQDLTIQGIRDEFTVLVYETHGRLALEKADHQEFNQCQTQLKALYGEGVSGHRAEFIAYRVLYFILTDKSADMSSLLKELTSDLRSTCCVDHALKVWSAWSLGNYHKFFKLYKSAPDLSGALIDMFVTKERKKAFKAMTKAFRPSLDVGYISSELGFKCDDDCLQFLVDEEATLDNSQKVVDCKLTAANH